MTENTEVRAWLEQIKNKVDRDVNVRETERPTWDEYFAKIVNLISKRSTCLYFREGAVVVRDRRILATGYSGSPKGFVHCTDVGCTEGGWGPEKGWPVTCRGLHAIQNAIIQGAIFDASIKDSEIYTNNAPCLTCTKMMINAEISRVSIIKPKDDVKISTHVSDMLERSGIGVRYIDDMDIRPERMEWIFE